MPSILFTEDGKTLNIGDDYFIVWVKELRECYELFTPFKYQVRDDVGRWSDDAKYFSTLEAANEFIEDHELRVSMADIKRAMKISLNKTTLVDILRNIANENKKNK